ncbi:DEKNAAC104855 [Brettanomyces naardenensis]|uniref:DEKNAAC104855 n=1 Tax=Brettanomyces naardenensis TaxID=13370 RepID=A0A448YRX7_BRENA|nr:DEKNAAC104855 [Brettanomyces naardenensis]
MSAWGNSSDDPTKRSGLPYNSAAGASGPLHRNLDTSTFNEQFPALDSSPPPTLPTNLGANSANGINNKPLLSQQLQTSRPAAQSSPNQTKANAQAILNAVKQASSMGNRDNSGAGIISTSQSATNILNSLSNNSVERSHSSTPTPQLPPGLIPAGPSGFEPKLGAELSEGSSKRPTAKEEELTEDIDKFGLKGLLPLLRVEPSDQATIATGIDLNMLGLDLSEGEENIKISKSFASPWLETSRSEVKPLFTNPPSFTIPAKDLANVETRIGNFNDETLFFIFYSKPRDTLQELAARELNNRNWRYHKDLQVWLTKDSSVDPVPNGPGSERGTYVFFDPTSWEYVTKDFVLSYQSII